MVSLNVSRAIEYSLHLVGIVLVLFWMLVVVESYSRGAAQLAGILLLLFLSVMVMWYFNEVR